MIKLNSHWNWNFLLLFIKSAESVKNLSLIHFLTTITTSFSMSNTTNHKFINLSWVESNNKYWRFMSRHVVHYKSSIKKVQRNKISKKRSHKCISYQVNTCWKWSFISGKDFTKKKLRISFCKQTNVASNNNISKRAHCLHDFSWIQMENERKCV